MDLYILSDKSKFKNTYMFLITFKKVTKSVGEPLLYVYHICIHTQKCSGIKHIKLITVVTSKQYVYVRWELNIHFTYFCV